MKYSIVCSSATGNGKILADAIYNHLGEKDCLYFGLPDDKALDADVIYVGFWTDMSTCNKEIAEFLKPIRNKKIFLFGTAGYGIDKAYLTLVGDHAAENVDSSNEIIGKYVCQGKMKMSVRDKYLIMKKQGHPNADALIKNFDDGQSHPDQNDIDELIKLIK